MNYTIELKCGNSRRKVENLVLSLGGITGKDNDWTYDVACSGAISITETQQANSPFDCIVLGLAYLRQTLRRYSKENPKLKYYVEIEGQLEEHSIEDVFWTHDCAPD